MQQQNKVVCFFLHGDGSSVTDRVGSTDRPFLTDLLCEAVWCILHSQLEVSMFGWMAQPYAAIPTEHMWGTRQRRRVNVQQKRLLPLCPVWFLWRTLSGVCVCSVCVCVSILWALCAFLCMTPSFLSLQPCSVTSMESDRPFATVSLCGSQHSASFPRRHTGFVVPLCTHPVHILNTRGQHNSV